MIVGINLYLKSIVDSIVSRVLDAQYLRQLRPIWLKRRRIEPAIKAIIIYISWFQN